MKYYKAYRAAAVLTTVMAVPIYFVDATVLVKALSVSSFFSLFVAWIMELRYEKKVEEMEKIRPTLQWIQSLIEDDEDDEE